MKIKVLALVLALMGVLTGCQDNTTKEDAVIEENTVRTTKDTITVGDVVYEKTDMISNDDICYTVYDGDKAVIHEIYVINEKNINLSDYIPETMQLLGIENDGKSIFNGNTDSILSIDAYESLGYVGENALSGLSNLSQVSLVGGTIEDSALSNNPKLWDITLDFTSYGDTLFENSCGESNKGVMLYLKTHKDSTRFKEFTLKGITSDKIHLVTTNNIEKYYRNLFVPDEVVNMQCEEIE